MNVVSKVPNLVRIRKVLVSVYDKTGLDVIIEGLIRLCPDVQIYSTGGTYAAIEQLLGSRAAGCLTQVSDYTGQPEMQGGLVKTLDYKIYLGLLSEPYNDAHAADMKRVDALYFDLTIVNLYPFGDTIAKPGISLEEARSFIDIGGPTMLRASAKNYLRVATVCNPADYAGFLAELERQGGSSTLAQRMQLSCKVFAATAAYDAAIADYLLQESNDAARSCYSIEGAW